jgi:hypothetical protein
VVCMTDLTGRCSSVVFNERQTFQHPRMKDGLMHVYRFPGREVETASRSQNPTADAERGQAGELPRAGSADILCALSYNFTSRLASIRISCISVPILTIERLRAPLRLFLPSRFGGTRKRRRDDRGGAEEQ